MNDGIEKAPENESTGTVSFSVRLTDKQRDLLKRAAEKRSWSITTLLKNAALEKAAHILNTSNPNQIDFREIAQKVADRMFAPRQAEVPNHEWSGLAPLTAIEDVDWTEPEPDLVVVRPWQLPDTFVHEMQEAIKYGGVEFLNLILDASKEVVTRRNPHLLTPPIDPATAIREK